MSQRRHMWDDEPATIEEQERFANRWGHYAQQHVDNQGRKPDPTVGWSDEVRWGDSKTIPFVFTANGSQTVNIDQIIDATAPARAWAIHVALTMVTPLEIPAVDTVAAFFIFNTGVGASTIRFRRLLDNTMFVPVPLPGGVVQDVADLIIPDVAGRRILIGCQLQYANTHGATNINVRVDAAAAPVMR
jgi:hypothetical protein